MRCRAVRSLAVLAATALCTALPATAQDQPAQVAPRDTLLWLSANQDICQKGLSLLALPPVAKMLDPQLNSPFAHMNKALQLPAGTVESVAPHVVAFSAGFARPEGGLNQMRGGPEEGLMFILSFDGEQWPAMIMSNAEPVEGGVLRLEDAPGAFWAIAGSQLVMTPSQKAAERYAGGDYARLAEDPTWNSAAKRAEDSPIWGWCPVPTLLDAILEMAAARERQKAEAVVETLGLRHVTGALLTAKMNETVAELQVTVSTDGESAGVLAVLPKGRMAMAKEVPADAAAALVYNWGNARKTFGGIRDLLVKTEQQVNPENPQLVFALATVEGMLGMPLDDFLGMIGTGLAAYIPHPGEDGMLSHEDWAVAIELTDGAAFQKTFENVLQKMMGQPPAPFEHGGLTMFRAPMAPIVLAFQPERLVIGMTPEGVARHTQWAAGAQGTLQLEQPDLWEYGHMDFGLLLKSYPRPEPGPRLTWTEERAGNDFVARLRFEAPDGIAVGSPAGAAAFTAIAAAMLMPALDRARTEARFTADKANLHNIGIALAIWQEDHDGAFPPNLKALVDDRYIEDVAVFVSPSDPDPPTVDGLRTSYVYIGTPLPGGMDPGTPLAYTREGIFPGRRNVLFRDIAVMTWGRHRLDCRMPAQDAYDDIVKKLGEQATDQRKKELREFFGLPERP